MKNRPNKLKKSRNSYLLNMRRDERLKLLAYKSKEKRQSILRILASILLGSIIIFIWIIIWVWMM